MSDEKTQKEQLLDVVRAIAPGHDPEFLVRAGTDLANRGLLGERATLMVLDNGSPVFVALDAWSHPTGCAKCGAAYADADGWGLVSFRNKGGSVGVVLCTACNERVGARTKGGA